MNTQKETPTETPRTDELVQLRGFCYETHIRKVQDLARKLERDLTTEREARLKAEREGGEMRAALQEIQTFASEASCTAEGMMFAPWVLTKVRSALASTTLGQGWRSPEEVKELERKISAYQESACFDPVKAQSLCNQVESLTKALELVKSKWTFDNHQQHTHTWHDWADCIVQITEAISSASYSSANPPPRIRGSEAKTAELEREVVSLQHGLVNAQRIQNERDTAVTRLKGLEEALKEAHPAKVWDMARQYYTHEESQDFARAWHKVVCEKVEQALAGSQGDGSPTSRDWPEDFTHENGQYLCKCHQCTLMFRGYKRRVVCKACATTKPSGGEAATKDSSNPSVD